MRSSYLAWHDEQSRRRFLVTRSKRWLYFARAIHEIRKIMRISWYAWLLISLDDNRDPPVRNWPFPSIKRGLLPRINYIGNDSRIRYFLRPILIEKSPSILLSQPSISPLSGTVSRNGSFKFKSYGSTAEYSVLLIFLFLFLFLIDVIEIVWKLLWFQI